MEKKMQSQDTKESENSLPEAKTKKCLGHDRAILLQTCTKWKLSEDTQLKISEIIKNTRLNYSSEAADEKAAELTELINRCKTEEAILEAIKDM